MKIICQTAYSCQVKSSQMNLYNKWTLSQSSYKKTHMLYKYIPIPSKQACGNSLLSYCIGCRGVDLTPFFLIDSSAAGNFISLRRPAQSTMGGVDSAPHRGWSPPFHRSQYSANHTHHSHHRPPLREIITPHHANHLTTYHSWPPLASATQTPHLLVTKQNMESHLQRTVHLGDSWGVLRGVRGPRCRPGEHSHALLGPGSHV